MRWCCAFLLALVFVLATVSRCQAAPIETALRNQSNAKSAFGQPFDEVVVESTLNVKRKATNTRQSKSEENELSRKKREHHHGKFHNKGHADPLAGSSSAAATAQAQSHEANSPFGKFGASASGSQSQSLFFGPNGPLFTAGFAGSQQYRLPNGQTLNVAFGDSLGGSASNKAGGATAAISGPHV